MKVAVLGSGNGACAVAFEWAKAGYDVFMGHRLCGKTADAASGFNAVFCFHSFSLLLQLAIGFLCLYNEFSKTFYGRGAP